MSDHETAEFFHRLKKGMEESIAHSRGELNLKTTALPLPPPPAGRARVIALRKKLRMSQAVFAAALNVSTKLVQSWEQGVRMPSRGELRLIEILARQPELVSSLILNGAPPRPGSGTPKARKRTPRVPVAS